MWALITGIPEALKGLFGLASKGLDYYIKRADGDVTKAVELMKADQLRITSQKEITLAAMGHWVWWIGWGGFVFPLCFYWAKVLVWDKSLGWGSTPPLTGFVLEWAGWIVGGLFCLQVGKGIVADIIKAVVKR